MDDILKIAQSRDTTNKEKSEQIEEHLKENLLSSAQTAKYLGISNQTFYKRLNEGIITPFIQTGKNSGGNLFYLPEVMKHADKLNIQKSKVNHRYLDSK
ncbi:helix-turn-helix transcriptional regulator [Alkalihalobacillus sp. NPDC078783]